MNLSFSEEQVMLRDTVGAYLSENYTFEQRQAGSAEAPHWRPEIWKALAEELQILGAAFPEELGGFGGNSIDNLILMQEFGRTLLVEPYLASVVMAGGIFKHSNHALAPLMIEQIITGERIHAFAFSERNSRFNLAAVETRAERVGDDWKISGHKKMVLAAPYAGSFIVTARTAGATREENGVSLFLLDAKAQGVSITPYMTYDGFRAADIVFDGVNISNENLIGEADMGFAIASRVMDEAVAALCGEAVGVMQTMLDLTLNYARDRKQFGKPISSFQALQHRMADMFIEIEQAKSISLLGAIRADDLEAAVREKGVSTAKAQIGTACKRVGQSAIQIHGGMGITEEMAVSHYFKRASAIEAQFGSVDYHLTRIERLNQRQAA